MSKFKTNYFSNSSLIVLLCVVFFVSERKTAATTATVATVGVAPAPAPASVNDSSTDSIWHTKHVYAYNSFSESDTFGISCKSGNDDLGFHEVGPGQYFLFQFKPSIFRTTLFFCTVIWHNYDISFDIYRYNRDSDRCDHNCNWHVRRDAVVGYMESIDYPDITIPWDRHPEL